MKAFINDLIFLLIVLYDVLTSRWFFPPAPTERPKRQGPTSSWKDADNSGYRN